MNKNKKIFDNIFYDSNGNYFSFPSFRNLAENLNNYSKKVSFTIDDKKYKLFDIDFFCSSLKGTGNFNLSVNLINSKDLIKLYNLDFYKVFIHDKKNSEIIIKDLEIDFIYTIGNINYLIIDPLIKESDFFHKLPNNEYFDNIDIIFQDSSFLNIKNIIYYKFLFNNFLIIETKENKYYISNIECFCFYNNNNNNNNNNNKNLTNLNIYINKSILKIKNIKNNNNNNYDIDLNNLSNEIFLFIKDTKKIKNLLFTKNNKNNKFKIIDL